MAYYLTQVNFQYMKSQEATNLCCGWGKQIIYFLYVNDDNNLHTFNPAQTFTKSSLSEKKGTCAALISWHLFLLGKVVKKRNKSLA